MRIDLPCTLRVQDGYCPGGADNGGLQRQDDDAALSGADTSRLADSRIFVAYQDIGRGTAYLGYRQASDRL